MDSAGAIRLPICLSIRDVAQISRLSADPAVNVGVWFDGHVQHARFAHKIQFLDAIMPKIKLDVAAITFCRF